MYSERIYSYVSLSYAFIKVLNKQVENDYEEKARMNVLQKYAVDDVGTHTESPAWNVQS